MIERLVAATKTHCTALRVVSPNKVASAGIKYTPRISPSKIRKLKLKK